MLKFVPNDTNGLPQKRAGSQRACERCRKRKKRCYHIDDSTNASDASRLHRVSSDPKRVRLSAQPEVAHSHEDGSAKEPLPILVGLGEDQSILDGGEPQLAFTSPATVDTNTASIGVEYRGAEAASHPAAQESNDSEDESRFIGHLNPEGAFLAAASPAHTTGSGEVEEVGIWLSDRGRGGKRKRYSALPMRKPRTEAIYCPDPVISKILLPHLEESCLSLLPDSTDFEALCNIYFDEIHPIFPILDRKSFETSPSHFPSTIAVGQVICLMASSSSAALPFLGLYKNGVRAALERGEFAHQLSLAVRTSLSLVLIKDKLILCQICALLSMFMQLADDRHLSAELCARAVAYAQTLGLHLPTRAGRENIVPYSRVFCCIWALDRLNAAFHGRPVTMHERDFGRGLYSSINAQDSCFQLFLRTTLLLDKVIDLYRPREDDSESDWGPDFPDFESVVHDADASRVKHNLLATIEIFYHAVAILSCRSQSLDQLPRSSPSYIRQSLSASRVLSIVAEDFYNQLSPMPIVPYAVSLALRFFYREFRFTKVPLFRVRAQKQLSIGCGILRELGEVFIVAAGIANLVEQTLNETNKVYSSIVQSQESDRPRVTRQTDTPVQVETPSAEAASTTNPPSIDWSLWDNMPGFDIFQHFDPSFNLEAIDAALADDTQTVFPTNFDGFTL